MGNRWQLRSRGRRRRTGRVTAALIALGMIIGVAPGAAAEEPAFVPNPHPHSIVIDWVDAMLLAIELNPPAPTATTWRMYVTMSSMYDAYAAYDRLALGTVTGYDLKRPSGQRTLANKERAVSYAAHNALSYLFPNQKDIFDAVMDLHGYPLSDSTDRATPAGVGNLAANAVRSARSADGSNAANGFADLPSNEYPEYYKPYNSADPYSTYSIWGVDFDPNRWTPLRVPNGSLVDENGNPMVDDDDPSTYADQKFLTPHWGAVDGFGLTSGSQFRPAAPPVLGSSAEYVDALGNVTTNDEAYRSQAAAVLETSGQLGDLHKVVAEFWADGPHTWTPPGHWVQLAIGVSLRDGHTLDQDVKMYLALTGAVLDAGIVAWDAKRVYDFVRPATAIPYLYAGQEVLAWAGPNLGIQLIDGADWKPYQAATFVTPGFAEYVSGHSTFSRASAEVLTSFVGSDAMYDGVTLLGRDYDGDGVEDVFGRHVAVPGTLHFEQGPSSTVVLTWDTFLQAADEAGYSRRYGGIHFQDGDLRAREMGREAGTQAYATAEVYWNPFGELRSTIIAGTADGQISRTIRSNLVRRVQLITVDAVRGNLQPACGRLGSLDRYVDARLGTGISSSAHEDLSRQIDLINSSLCG